MSSKSRLRNANHQYYSGQYQAKTPIGNLPSIEKLANMAPDFNYEHVKSQVSTRHLGYRKNMESPGMSRALGGMVSNRYENNAARVISQARNERGPCPRNLYKSPSIPSIISDVDRKSAQYQQDLQRGLQQVYSYRRRVQRDIFENGSGSYHQSPASRYRQRDPSKEHAELYSRIY